MSNKVIYCLDCESSFEETLKTRGFEIVSGSLGYSSGICNITEPPNECDVIVFNLTKPGLFDMDKWGPDGGNDNYKCNLVKKFDKTMYIRDTWNGKRKYPRFQLIQDTQISDFSSTFNYNHLQKAISNGGIDCIYYLNPVFMFHSLYDTPDWVGLKFSTDITKAKRWNVDQDVLKICESLGVIGSGDLELRRPIEFKLLDLTVNLRVDFPEPLKINLITNNVDECFAAIVQIGKGFIYFLPPFKKPVEATSKLIKDVLPSFKRAYATFLQSSIKVPDASVKKSQEISEKIYAPGEQYTVYRDLKEIVGGAKKEIFIIDSYADEEIFDLYVGRIKAGVAIKFLTKSPSKNLRTVISKFKAKPGVKIETRSYNKIHDRVIFIDGEKCWVIGQSFKDAAVKAPTYLLPIDSIVDMRNLYENIWSSAATF